MKITHTAVASGNSHLTAGGLLDFVGQIPREATLQIEAESPVDQRDNHRWTAKAEWDEVAQQNWIGGTDR